MTHQPDEHLIDLLLRRFAWMEKELDQRLKEAGWQSLSRTQIMLFSYLHGEGSRASDIARVLRISRQAVHQMVKELEIQDLIKQIPDPVQGNAKLIIKTEKGYALNDIARDILRNIDQVVEKRIGKQSLQNLRTSLLADWDEPGKM